MVWSNFNRYPLLYIVLYIVLAFFSSLDWIKHGEKIKPVIFFLLVTALMFISAIRWNVGTDWYSYLEFYQNIDGYVSNPIANGMEYGFTYINYLISSLNASYSVYLAIMAVLTIGLKSAFLYRHKEILMVSLFLYYCYFFADIFAVRQFLAISICLLSVSYIEKRKVFPFILLILLACSIHITSIIFFFAYTLFHKKFSSIVLYGILGVALIAGFVDLGGMLTKLAMNIVGIDSRVGEKLLAYGEDGIDTAVGNPYVAFGLGVAKRALFLPVFIVMRDYVEEAYRKRYNGYLNLLVLGNMLYFLFMISLPVMARLSTGLLFFEIPILGYMMISIQDRKLQGLVWFLIILFGAFRLYNLIAVYWDLYLPFETIFAPSDIHRE